MTEPVIPYATRERQGLTPRGLFGVIVRTAGLAMAIWGLYTLSYLISIRMANAPTDGQPPASFLIYGLFLMGCGLVLLRGEWIVRFAYGPDSQ